LTDYIVASQDSGDGLSLNWKHLNELHLSKALLQGWV